MKIAGLISIPFILTTLVSCASTKFLRSESYLFQPSTTQDNLLIFLPGRSSDMTDFEKQGLLAAFRSTGIPADSVSVDATLPFYMDRSLLTRLDTDVFGKPELAEYKNYWFIGNSMGALGSFLYAQAHPGKIKGIILLGPFLGEGQVPDEIAAAGGLLKWESKIPEGKDYIRDIWVYIKNCVQDHSGKFPEIIFLAGQDDRYHKIQSLVAQSLPSDHVFWASGGHDWDAWNAVFLDFMKSEKAGQIFLNRKNSK